MSEALQKRFMKAYSTISLQSSSALSDSNKPCKMKRTETICILTVTRLLEINNYTNNCWLVQLIRNSIPPSLSYL